jgi:hypothetical protein
MIRLLLLVCALRLVVPLTSFGQTSHCDSAYAIVDEIPKFGELDFTLYLAKNVKFGKCGMDEMKIFTWTVDTEGQMINIDAPTLEGQCKQDIIGQLEKFPRWKPGKLKGRLVCVKMTLRMCIKTG